MKVTRVEVYGLFILSLIIGGGSIAYASGDATPASTATPTATATPTPTQTVDPAPAEVMTLSVATPVIVPSPAPIVEGPHPVDTRIRGPYIGDGGNFQYDSANYLCAWTTNGYGGRGYGYGPEAICNKEYINYIASNCGTKDLSTGLWSGKVYRQLCDEWQSHTLRIDYEGE